MPSALVSEWQLKQNVVPVCARSRAVLHAVSPSATRQDTKVKADLMSVLPFDSGRSRYRV